MENNLSIKILLASPDESWLTEAANYFSENLYSVDKAINGKEAQELIAKNRYFCVIINSKLSNHSAYAVIRFIKSKYANQKTVVTLDSEDYEEDSKGVAPDKLDSESVEAQFREQNIENFLYHPFELTELKSFLEGQQSYGQILKNLKTRSGQSDEVEIKEQEGDYTPIPIDEIYLQKAVLFDLYVKIGKDHFVKILHAGDTFSRERIDRYKDQKKIENLYIHRTDIQKYIQYMNHTSKKVLNTKASAKIKSKVIQNSARKIYEAMSTEGLKPQIIQSSMKLCNNVYSFVEKDQDLWKLLRKLENIDLTELDHAFIVALYSTATIKQFEWESKTMLETMAFSAFFHDIGKLKLPEEIALKRPHEMNDEQLSLYHQHPNMSAELLEASHKSNHAATQIIQQHHEYYDGSGFPNGLKGSKILTLANILCLADDFVHLMHETQQSPIESLRSILKSEDMVKRYNSQVLEKFIQIFADPQKIASIKKKQQPVF